ncbi:1-aminocyclopropane-1-carboxylate deaminase [Acinetobacter sp. NCu2D-2]|uniref:1-aminocyclopropane-1-carboxylate deaminase/D-cysteine desulfhydrase n=1 Tax=Acinetobacter sp. NCu2D-2 TaxID=1608473 RepID=UPI0007CDF5F3|nr:pyridoxal-phosphate dependent enzyme [Acinetobacter sp. NCu2D-2]ANF83153.1 1-aminocyclopropane-1-carboxylate deaminase [Acinetobacter sp. NCu2D-2]
MFDSIAQHIPDQQIVLHDHLVTIRRLDLVHPRISGNKFFKLKYNFQHAKKLGFNKVLTFGGAYSNHIAATAFAAHHFGFKSIGIIRGEELQHKTLNSTLKTAQDFNMQLEFVSREMYRQKQNPAYLDTLKHSYPDYYVIPEGGTNEFAIQGCREILKDDDAQFDLICCAVGTGGTMTGLIEASQPRQQVLGFSALKGTFLNEDVAQLTSKRNWKILDDYCCGGYAKTTDELMRFIHTFETQHHIPLEQIYTGKMMLGLSDLIQKKQLNDDTKILVIHTGGLQGRSF